MSQQEQIRRAAKESRREGQIDSLPQHVRNDVQEWIDEGSDRSVTLYNMSPREIFEAYMEWNGIQGYDHIYDWMSQLYAIAQLSDQKMYHAVYVAWEPEHGEDAPDWKHFKSYDSREDAEAGAATCKKSGKIAQVILQTW